MPRSIELVAWETRVKILDLHLWCLPRRRSQCRRHQQRSPEHWSAINIFITIGWGVVFKHLYHHLKRWWYKWLRRWKECYCQFWYWLMISYLSPRRHKRRRIALLVNLFYNCYCWCCWFDVVVVFIVVVIVVVPLTTHVDCWRLTTTSDFLQLLILSLIHIWRCRRRG